jgi:VWFA-related protein
MLESPTGKPSPGLANPPGRIWSEGVFTMLTLRARCFRSILLVALFAMVAAMTTPRLRAQAAPAAAAPAAQAAPSTTITTTADEVSLDLVVRTKGGKPILNLQPSDLAVTDNGAPVKLSDFHLVTGASESDHLVTLVFDHLDTAPAKAARELAEKMLRTFPPRGYTFAILAMNGRLRLIQSWTADHDTVLKAVADATNPAAPANASGLTPAEKAVIADSQDDSLSTDFADRSRARLLVAGLEDSQRLLEDQHAYPSLTALQALAMSEKQITGRKFIVWFSQGITANNDSRDAVRSLAAQANRAGVTVVAIDTEAMNEQMGDKMMGAMAMAGPTGPGGAMAAAATLGSTGYGRGATVTTPIGQVMDAAQNMSSFEFDTGEDVRSPLIRLASDTGGIYFRAGGSTKGPLRELDQDLTDYYEASYVPDIKDYNGAFRPIAVTPLRKGIVVRTRAGYFALPSENGSGLRPFEVPLLSILTQPKFPTDVAFQTEVLHLGRLPDGNSADLAVQVPVSQIQIHDDGNTRLSSLHVSILAQIKDEKGAVVQRFGEDIPRHEAPDMLRMPDGQFITMQRHFSAAPGTYTLETAVMDRIGNKAGAQRITFTIAPPPPGPALSDVTLVRTIEPIHADTASFEPMRYMSGRIVPDLAQMLPEGTKSLSVFFLVHPLPPSAGQPQLSMQILRNGESLGKMPLDLSTTDGLGAVPYLGTIGGHAFPPGSYKVVATLTQGGQTATSDAAFSVEGTIAATMASNDTAFSATSGSATDAAALAADQRDAAAEVAASSKFVIAAATNPVPPPTAADAHDMIEAARKRALAWSEMLPNFICLEITDHSVDPEGDGDWHHKDQALQIMRYVDHQETRTTLELNGQRNMVNNAGAATPLPSELDFAHSIGEFGGMFQLVFDPSAQAKFTWQESDTLDGQPAQVFAYQVALPHSNFSLAGANMQQLPVAFHGLVYLDTATHSIRRITVDADNIPDTLKVRATSLSVDYNWVTISGHDYLMPSRGAVSLREGKRQAVLNEFEFRNYRRFGSQVRILSTAESQQLKKTPAPQ